MYVDGMNDYSYVGNSVVVNIDNFGLFINAIRNTANIIARGAKAAHAAWANRRLIKEAGERGTKVINVGRGGTSGGTAGHSLDTYANENQNAGVDWGREIGRLGSSILAGAIAGAPFGGVPGIVIGAIGGLAGEVIFDHFWDKNHPKFSCEP